MGRTAEQIQDNAEARAAQVVAMRRSGSVFSEIGRVLGVGKSRARELYLKGLRIERRGPRALRKPVIPEPRPLPQNFRDATRDFAPSLIDSLVAEGFHNLSGRILSRVMWVLPLDAKDYPKTLDAFADLMILGTAKKRWHKQPFNGKLALDVLAWAEPRGTGAVKISAERRAELEVMVSTYAEKKAAIAAWRTSK